MATETKPIFKAPEKKPFQVAPEQPAPPSPKPEPAPAPVEVVDEWKPIATAPLDKDARFMVRATVLGKDGKRTPVPNTATVVRYRMSRKMVGGRWAPALTIIDDLLETKLGFRPNEWNAYIPPPPKPIEKKANA